MSAVPALLDRRQAFEALRAQLSSGSPSHAPDETAARRLTGCAAVDDALPGRGFPTHAVIELRSPLSLGSASRIVMGTITQALARPEALAAWVDPEATLSAPALVMAGIDLQRLVVVRPSRTRLGSTAVRLAAAGIFDVLAIDLDPIGGAPTGMPQRSMKREVLVRKLCLHAETFGTTIVLITRAETSTALPVALRLDLCRLPTSLTIAVTKDRLGRVGLRKTVGCDHTTLLRSA